MWVFICILKLLAKINAKSHCLQKYDLSPEWVLTCVPNLLSKKCKVTLFAKLRFISRVSFHMFPQITRQNQWKIPCCCCRIDHCQKQRSQAHRGSSYLNIPRWAWAGTVGCPSSQRSRKTSIFEMFSNEHVGTELILKKMFPTFLCAMVSFRPLSTSPKTTGRLQKSAKTILNVVKCNFCQYRFNLSSDLKYHPTI